MRPKVCLCLREGVQPGTGPSETPPSPANSDEDLTDVFYSAFGYNLTATGALGGNGSPECFTALSRVQEDNSAIISISRVLTPLQCLHACDALPTCAGVVIEQLPDDLQCYTFSDVSGSDVEACTTAAVSVSKADVSGGASLDPGVLHTLVGDGTTAFQEGADSGLHTGLNQAGYLKPIGQRYVLMPLISDHIVVRIDLANSDHRLEVIAGTGTAGNGGVGNEASFAQLNKPSCVIHDIYGNLYIAEEGNHRVSRIDAATGVLSVVVGTGKAGHRGMGGDGAAAQINEPRGLALDAYGRLYISDQANHAIYRYDIETGIIQLIAGTPGKSGHKFDDGEAADVLLNRPTGMAIHQGNQHLFVADTDNNRIRLIVLSTGKIETVAGAGPRGDGAGVLVPVAATEALLNNPEGVDVSADGNYLIIADTRNHALRGVNLADADAALEVILGNGHRSFNGDNHSPTETRLNTPLSVLFTNNENAILFVDQGNRRIRRLWGGAWFFEFHLQRAEEEGGHKYPRNQHLLCGDEWC